MRHKHLRNIIIFGTVVLLGMAMIQAFWFKRAFDIADKQFDHKVQVALKTVADQMVSPSTQFTEVKKLASNFYLVQVNGPLAPSKVNHLLQQAFHLRQLKLEYEIGIYNTEDDTLVYSSHNTPSIGTGSIDADYPFLPADHGLLSIAVRFPGKVSHIASELKIWMFSSVLLLLMFCFFAYAIYSILREKRYAEMKNDFINNLTHELKTPVSNIQIAGDVLRKKWNGQQDLNYLSIIDKENRKLQSKIDTLLQSASLEYHTDPKMDQVDMHALLAECAKTFEMKVHARNGKINLKLDAKKHVCYGDKLLLKQAFENLIDNAEKYTHESPEISISTNMANRETMYVSIKDNGIGISRQFQQKVFEKFFRIRTENIQKVKGFGLGLSFARDIIRKHNGRVSIQSVENHGTSIKILFPV